MANNLTHTRIRTKDLNLLRNEVKIEFLKHHPEFSDISLTDPYLIKQLIKYYLGEEF